MLSKMKTMLNSRHCDAHWGPCLSILGWFDGADEDEGDFGGVPRATSGEGGGYGTGLLQRLAETGHQGRRSHRGKKHSAWLVTITTCG